MKAITFYEKSTSFLWQHLWLVISLFVMTLGAALCVRSNIGSSVISTIPFTMELAGKAGSVPALTIGEYTNIMNALFVGLQIIILRRQFELIQLFQLIMGFIFGLLLDVNMALTAPLVCDSLLPQIGVQLLGCIVLALGISLEIRCGSITMPGEGIVVAVSKASGIKFPKAKIMIDTTMVICAVALGYIFFGKWLWNVVGVGTILAMVLVGVFIKMMNPYMGWFERVLNCKPGFQRHIYGLARYLYRHIHPN